MNILTTIRRKRSSASTLSVALLAWLGVLMAPCAMASSPDKPANIQSPSVGVHAKCPNETASLQPMAEADCCCDLGALIEAKPSELTKVHPIIALRIGQSIDPQAQAQGVLIDSQKPPIHESSPPVYLATQRLRL